MLRFGLLDVLAEIHILVSINSTQTRHVEELLLLFWTETHRLAVGTMIQSRVGGTCQTAIRSFGFSPQSLISI